MEKWWKLKLVSAAVDIVLPKINPLNNDILQQYQNFSTT